jgi:hypothetical protein
VGLEAVGEAVEVGLAPGGEVDGGGVVQAGPGEQGGEGFGLVEQAVEIGAEDLPVGRRGAVRAAVGEVRARAGEAGPRVTPMWIS